MKSSCSVETGTSELKAWLSMYSADLKSGVLRLSVKRVHGNIVLVLYSGDDVVRVVDGFVFDSFQEAKHVRECVLCWL